MIEIIEFGNIFNIPGVHNYAHGCNCAGAMGKGIAKQFRERYPKMYTEYKQLCKTKQFKVGDVFLYKTETECIFNLGTQHSWTTKAILKDVIAAFRKMCELAEENQIKSIALPTIGAGLGGLRWENVKSEIFGISSSYSNINLFIVENYVD